MARPSKQSRELFKGDIVGAWTIVSESPVRTAKGLMWTCACPQEHHTQIAHHDLQFGVVPTQCTECAEQARVQRAAAKIEERELSKVLAKELAIAALEKLHQPAPVVEQQEVQEEVNASTT